MLVQHNNNNNDIFNRNIIKNTSLKGLTEFETVSTVDVKVVVTWLPLAAEGVKDQTVWAELLL